MKNIVILDYVEGQVYIRPVPDKIAGDDGDEIMSYFCDELNLSANDCHYMIINRPLAFDVK